ncbi:MAG: hypothetical protein QXJ28_02965, partial [Candidatus Pacearchaeota archaeon]
LGRILSKDKEKLKRAITYGSITPIILYILFTITFVGILGSQVKEVATISLGKPVAILGIFTMLTSYFVLSFALKDMLIYDLKINKKFIFWLVSFIPIAIYLITELFGFASFVKIIGIGGVISGGIKAILIVMMNYKSKKHGERKPEYSMPINIIVIILIILIFTFGILLELNLINIPSS